ncbi:HutD family protein [Pseudomonas sp. RIT-PI-S]|uniref:HutD/Ves family protein n=1 Tax=Pseudomonas sp. RIT-PI-S TaxID=3035295 RepID=UPI0021D91C4E|nr:HutD family protein [Pseudomonas sp. RIT-PI-S]
MKLLRAADYLRTPWKNGGGSTLEVCRDQGAGLDEFGWRLSIADIAQPGPFSSFAGYERVITVLEGQGMVLQVDGRSSGPLRPYQPFEFSGASEVSCELIDGPIRDFNLIYAPVRYQAQLQWLDAAARVSLKADAGTRIIFAAVPTVRVELAGNSVTLGQHDTLLLNEQAAVVTGRCALIQLQPL